MREFIPFIMNEVTLRGSNRLLFTEQFGTEFDSNRKSIRTNDIVFVSVRNLCLSNFTVNHVIYNESAHSEPRRILLFFMSSANNYGEYKSMKYCMQEMASTISCFTLILSVNQ